MIVPIGIKEYMDKISRKYHSLPEGEEKDMLFKEIVRVAEWQFPTIKLEDISENNEEK